MKIPLLLLLLAVSTVSLAQYSTPAKGTKLRTAILDGVRPYEGGGKVKFLVGELKTDGKWAFFQGLPEKEDSDREAPQYFLKKVGARWKAMARFQEYHEGDIDGRLMAWDLRALRKIGLPIGLIPADHRKVVKKGWWIFGWGFQHSGIREMKLTEAEATSIGRATSNRPASVQGFKSYRINRAELLR